MNVGVSCIIEKFQSTVLNKSDFLEDVCSKQIKIEIGKILLKKICAPLVQKS